MDLSIADWRLLQLTLEGIGPFRQGRTTLSFRGETPPKGVIPGPGLGEPANLFMLIAPNGIGKTTVLEAIYGMFALLNRPSEGMFSSPLFKGAAQLDLRSTWLIDGFARSVLLSMWIGSKEPLIDWTGVDLEEAAGASDWARLSLAVIGREAQILEESNDLGRAIFREMQTALETPTDPQSHSSRLPTLLYFPADRSVAAPQGERIVARPADWGYQPAHQFSLDGPAWNSSMDNLLAWMESIGDAQLPHLLKTVNDHVFGESPNKRILSPDPTHLLTFVETPSGFHPLSDLSHGERSLLQMFVRVFAHMTRNTILLIDEIELHLHTRWMNRMFESFKRILQSSPGLTLIFTSHDRELIHVFDHETPEPGLTKGGFLITRELA